MKKLSLLKAGAATAVIALTVSTPAFAQDAAAQTEETVAAEAEAEPSSVITVTGSRIARPELEGAAPLIAVVGSEQIERRGFINVAQALNEIPGFGTPVSSAGDQSSYSVGQNFVNLFGIGSQRTLTLVNGRRFVSSNTASNFGGAAAGLQVDLNVIPVSLIDRVDVLAVKGATTYGSDAIAGTVNLILKDDFEGLEATGQQGIYQAGDGESTFGSITAGGNFADGRGNIAANFEYANQKGVLTNSRALGRQAIFRDSEDLVISPDRIFLLTGGGLPTRGGGLVDGGYITTVFGLPEGGFRNAAGNFVQFNNQGQLVDYDIGDTSDGNLVRGNGGDGLDLNRAGQLLSDLERYSLFAIGHYDVTDNISFFFEGNYASTRSTELANQPVYQSGLFSGDSLGLGVNLSNPFLTDQARSVLLRPGNLADAAGNQILNVDTDGDGVNDDTQFFLQRAGFDLLGGSAPDFQQLDLFRIVGGFKGDFEVGGGRNWNWNASYSFGRSQAISSSRSLVQANFLNAVDVVTDPATGNPVCRVTLNPPTAPGTGVGTPAQPNSVTACVPLNLFGEGVASREAIDFVTTTILAESSNQQNIFNANLGGGLFDLFDNEVGFNVGYENRRERQTFTPDGFQQQGLGRSTPITPVDGSFSTNEFFAEVLVPIITPGNDSFIHRLEFDGSFRYIDNSIAGSGEVWSVGTQFAPVADLTFRGSYTESVRAPAITELFLGQSQLFSFADDPCDPDFIDDGNNPARRLANCQADGLPVGFDSQIDDASQEISTSGNPNLLNEESKSWTVGAILQPRFIPGLSLAVDWVDIELTNAIVQLDLTSVLRACYDNEDFPNAILPDGQNACNLFQRDSNFQIIGAQTGQANAGSFDFAGLQATLQYNFDLAGLFGGEGDLGNLNLLGRYFYTDTNRFVVVGVPDDNAGEIGNFKHSFNGQVVYTKDNFQFALTGNYLSGASFDLEEDQSAPFAKVGDYLVFDATLGVDVSDKVSLGFTVNNLFEEEPPFPSRDPAQYGQGMLGREFLFRITTRM